MPKISVPSPLATYIVYGVFLCLCFGQWAVGFFVSPRYRWSYKRRHGIESTAGATLEQPHQPPETP